MPGRGNPNAVRVWSQIDVYAAEQDTDAPLQEDFYEEPNEAVWDLVGLISAEQAPTWTPEQEVNKIYVHGGALVRSSLSKQAITAQFTPVENNHVVWELANPGSDAVTTGDITERTVRPRNIGLANRAFLIDFFDGSIKLRRFIPSGQAMMLDAQTFGEAAEMATPITVDTLLSLDEDDESYFYRDWTDDPAAVVSAS